MAEIKRAKTATSEEVDAFLKGSDPQERIIKIECSYDDVQATVIYRDEDGTKHYSKENFYPFCWAKREAGQMMFGGDRTLLKMKLQEYGISCKGLIVANKDGYVPQRMEDGYRVMFKAIKPMSNKRFSEFFDEARVPLKPREKDKTYGKRLYITVAPVEQFMIETGKRLFKGYETYDDLVRTQFDIETTGLDKKKDLIDQIGIRTNKGFEKIITVTGNTREEKIENGRKAINQFFDIIDDIDPDVISGYNSESFDYEFFDIFLKEHFGTDMGSETKRPTLKNGCYKKKQQSVLKLGGEIEYYYPTVIWGKHVTDCLFSVRRAQALDSNMKKATLKYVTKYSKIAKENRVYVPGKIINTIWSDLEFNYAFNNKNGDWYKITDNKPLKEGYTITNGKYIVERYLLDDLWETDKVELRYNESNFLVGKMLPVNFERMCTMGTATIWKYIMFAWSFEHDLAIPSETSSRSFTGGLSRLLTVGYIPNVQKLDYNSLYPSIILSFGIKTPIDISGAMPAMLEYILTQREYFKALKNKYKEQADNLEKECDELIKSLRASDEYSKLNDKEFEEVINNDERVRSIRSQQAEASMLSIKYDKMQSPVKVIANAFFGSFGSGGGVFPWSDIDCAEETTCCGRQMLRLMLKWFSNIGYEGIVCDSVTEDTPLFIKYNDTNQISIKPISELFGKPELVYHNDGREYSLHKRDYKILCRSGWCEPKYFYRHDTDKDVYRVEDEENDMIVDVTKDHSLFNEEKSEIKPTEIEHDTKLEYYDGESIFTYNTIELSDDLLLKYALKLKYNELKEIPDKILNSTIRSKSKFLEFLFLSNIKVTVETHNKTIVAGIQYLKNCLKLQ